MTALYVQPAGPSNQNHTLFFVVLLVLATLTVRTTMMHDETWLIHAGSLGSLIVAGAMRRPDEASDAAFSNY
jgi:hypothetical protein